MRLPAMFLIKGATMLACSVKSGLARRGIP
jgi:hypothetical protein